MVKIDFLKVVDVLNKTVPTFVSIQDYQNFLEKERERYIITQHIHNKLLLPINKQGVSRSKILSELRDKNLKMYPSFKHHIRRYEENCGWIKKVEPVRELKKNGRKLKPVYWKIDKSELRLEKSKQLSEAKLDLVKKLMRIPDITDNDINDLFRSIKRDVKPQ